MCRQFLALGYPLILLDTYFDGLDCTSVLINNAQGAYIATNSFGQRISAVDNFQHIGHGGFNGRRQFMDNVRPHDKGKPF